MPTPGSAAAAISRPEPVRDAATPATTQPRPKSLSGQRRPEASAASVPNTSVEKSIVFAKGAMNVGTSKTPVSKSRWFGE